MYEKEQNILPLLFNSGTQKRAYWLGTFLYDFCVYSVLLSIFMITGISFEIQEMSFQRFKIGYTLTIFVLMGVIHLLQMVYLLILYNCLRFFKTQKSAINFLPLLLFLGLWTTPSICQGINYEMANTVFFFISPFYMIDNFLVSSDDPVILYSLLFQLAIQSVLLFYPGNKIFINHDLERRFEAQNLTKRFGSFLLFRHSSR